MAPTITFSIEVPDGVTVSIKGIESALASSAAPARDPAEEYFNDYLSPSGRKLYRAAAGLERERDGGGFTFEDIASVLGVDYESAKSYHRNSGRTAARWEREQGTATPIQLEHTGEYGPQQGADGWRSRYTLGDGVAERILEIPAA